LRCLLPRTAELGGQGNILALSSAIDLAPPAIAIHGYRAAVL
jgi:hypothetical protein